MEVQFGPNAVDEPSLLYKLQRKIKVFNTNNALPNRGYNLVSSCSKYGLVFIVSPNSTLSAYYLKDLIDKECEPQHLTLSLQAEPTHISVNCDQEWLAVISKTMLLVYKITDFQNQNISPSFSIKLDVNQSTFVSAVQWNPCIPDIIAIAFFDGTLLVSQITTMQIKKLQSSARCICWSPKGKQIVTGNSDGTLCQYKPDLSPMKIIPAPNLFDGAPIEALAIYWISTYQFAVVYKNVTDNSRPAVTIVNTPKGGQPSCYNYEDICYSTSTIRPWYYYLQGLPQWNLLLGSSSNSMEIATLASADGASWLQWCQTDEARPELPLTDKQQENFPVGLSIDTSAVHQLPWGENEFLPPMPLLLLVSQTGLLSIFNIIYLKKDAAPVCTITQPLMLQANIMTSVIPDDVPKAAPVITPPAAIQPMPQTVQSTPLQLVSAQPQPEPQPALSALNEFSQSFGNSNSQQFVLQNPQAPLGVSTVLTPEIAESKTESKPQIAVAQNVASVAQPTPVATEVPKAQSPIQTQEINAALKSEQERINRIKANEELKNMLIKEINDFQMELYTFMAKTRETHVKLQQDIELMAHDFKIQPRDIEELKADCSVEKLREAVIMLKLDLVQTCAVVAEAQTHAENKHLHDWSQADPLTTKRVASIKKLAYYVRNQIDQACKVLDHKWNEMSARNDKPGQHMLRPILDDIYQPLVKQQEILSRQQAVLKTLRNTLKECGDISSVFKSTSILRSTPLRNNADALSKLTKNILNMSIEPKRNKVTEPPLSNQKLEALRDMLSNHKTVNIKPVNVELRQQLETMRLNYEKSIKEKKDKEIEIKIQSDKRLESDTPTMKVPLIAAVKPDTSNLKTNAQVINVPTYTPVSNTELIKSPFSNVARVLFTNDSGHEETTKIPSSKEQEQVSMQVTIEAEQQKPSSGTITVTSTTRDRLKDVLQNKSQAKAELNNDPNTFMGQKICSPTAINYTKTSTTPAANSSVFPSKPITGVTNLFNNTKPLLLSTDQKPQLTKENIKSSETGEPEDAEATVKSNSEKPLSNIFILKSSTHLATTQSQNVPDVLKTITQDFTANKVDANNKTEVSLKVKDKAISLLKENIPEKESEKLCKESQKITDEKKDEPKPFSLTNKPTQPIVSATLLAEPKENLYKSEIDVSKTEVTVKTLSSVFNASNTNTVSKPQVVFGATTTQAFTNVQTTVISTTHAGEMPKEKKTESLITPTASSVFGTAVASQNTSTSEVKSIPPGSIFATAGNWPASSSIFGKPTATVTTESTSSAQSLFRSAASSALFPPSTSTPTSVTPKASTSEPAVDSTPSISTPPAVSTSTNTPVFAARTESSVFSISSDPSSSEPAFAPTSSTQSIFNITKSTAVFGTASTTTQSMFENATTTTSSFWSSSSKNWGFANANQPVFGGVTTQSPPFGTPTPSTQASLFGIPTQTTQSVFGSTTPTSQPSVFGTPPTTGSSSLFGGGEANMFAAATISTTKASSPTSGGNIFGGSPGSLFSGGGTNTNVFGGSQSAASIFGEANTTFKQNNPNNFWSGGANATSGNAFGSSVFGQQPTTQASIFGGSPGGSFSAPSTGQPLGNPQSGAFGTGDAKPSIFGSPQQQTSPAFGGSPVFGTKPVFGQTASFGSPTGFGSGFNKSPGGGFGAPAAFGSPAFGGTSPGKIFGGSSPTSGFGAPAQTNATFDSLATQNTLTFGNLAQQSAQQAQPQPPSFNTSPSFTGWRG